MRRSFGDTLLKMAEEDPRVIFLTGDLGFQVFDSFRDKFGPRYVNVGVAEAQLMCAAAGLALEGWRPIAYSIASFATSRPYEQIKISIAYQELPVVVVGAGGGYTYSNAGVTHHAPDDLGLMSALPGMTVTAPGSPEEVAAILPALLRLPGPSYMRIGKFGEPNYKAMEPPVLGKARLLLPGERVAIVSTGDMAAVAIEAALSLNADGIRPAVYQMHTVKPLDKDALDSIASSADTIITIEEHLPTGGLGAAVSMWLAERGGGPRLVRLGAPDAFAFGSPERSELRRRIGCDAESLRQACLGAWAGRKKT